MEKNVVAFDFGSTQIRVAACTFDDSQPNGNIRIVGNKGKNISGLLIRGKIVDEEKLSKVVSDLFAWAQGRFQNSTKQVSVCASLEGMNYRGIRIKADMGIANRKIERSDLRELQDKAKSQREDADDGSSVVVNIRPVWYSVDNEVNTLDVVGKECSNTLYSCFVAGLVSKSTIQSMNKVFTSSAKPKRFYPTASSKAVGLVLPSMKNESFALVDIGAETIGVAIYNKGVLEYEDSYPFGSLTISKDIAAGLNVSLKDAEAIKLEVGIPPEDKAKSTYEYVTESGEKVTFSGSKLSFFILARLEELASYIQLTVNKFGRSKLGSVILTGGGSLLKGIEVPMRKALDLPVSVDQTKISDMSPEDVISFSCAIGMAKLYASNERQINSDKKKPSVSARTTPEEPAQEPEEEKEKEKPEPPVVSEGEAKPTPGKKSLVSKMSRIFGSLFDADGYNEQENKS